LGKYNNTSGNKYNVTTKSNSTSTLCGCSTKKNPPRENPNLSFLCVLSKRKNHIFFFLLVPHKALFFFLSVAFKSVYCSLRLSFIYTLTMLICMKLLQPHPIPIRVSITVGNKLPFQL